MSPQPSLDRFKTLQALYVEDDPVIRESIGASLNPTSTPNTPQLPSSSQSLF